MQKAIAIYHAPEGDAKVCEMCGVTFVDGKEVELNSDDNPHLLKKLPGNRLFEVKVSEDDEKPRRGRPPKPAEVQPEPEPTKEPTI